MHTHHHIDQPCARHSSLHNFRLLCKPTLRIHTHTHDQIYRHKKHQSRAWRQETQVTACVAMLRESSLMYCREPGSYGCHAILDRLWASHGPLFGGRTGGRETQDYCTSGVSDLKDISCVLKSSGHQRPPRESLHKTPIFRVRRKEPVLLRDM